MHKKILVAVDGSAYSTNSLRYLGQLFKDVPEMDVHLLSIVSAAGTGSAAREWLSEEEMLNVVSPATRKALTAQKKYMLQAIETLKMLGVPETQVESSVSLSRLGIAEDILHLARQGRYDALLIGRRGVGKLEELIMGSVSATILEKCHDLPLWIIDGQVNSTRFLVPVDGSYHSLKAIDHLAFILAGNPHAEITLFYSKALLASRPEIDPADFETIWGRDWCATNLHRPDSLFHAPKQLLLDNGFPEERISWLETFKGIEPAQQILRQAVIDDFGTIVIGRRGPESKKGIFRGVSDRVLLMAEKVAVWIVG